MPLSERIRCIIIQLGEVRELLKSKFSLVFLQCIVPLQWKASASAL